MNINETRAAIEQLRTEAEQILDANPQGLAGEARSAFEDVESRLKAQTERLAKMEQIRDAAQNPANVIPGSAPDDPKTGPVYQRQASDPYEARDGETVTERRGRALTAVEGWQVTDEIKEGATLHIERNAQVADHILRTSSPDFISAWQKWSTNPEFAYQSFTPAEARAWQDAAEIRTTLSLGGGNAAVVPAPLDPSVTLLNDGIVNPLRDVATVKSITSSQWSGLTSASITASYDAELATVSDDTPTIGNPQIPAHKAQAYAELSIEALGDMVNAAGELSAMFVDARSRLEGEKFINGSGSDEPTGIVYQISDDGTYVINEVTSETFTAADVYALQQALAPRWRSKAVWFAEASTLNAIAQFETTNGARLFPTVDSDTPTLLRRRVYEASAMDGAASIDAGATASNEILLFVDPTQYIIVDRVGMVVEAIPHVFDASNANRPKGARAFYCWWRNGAELVSPQVGRLLDVTTTA